MASAATRRWGVVVAVCAVAGLCGCAPRALDGPPDTAVRIPDSASVTGIVTAVGRDDLAVDIGTTRPLTVALADIAATNCAPDGTDQFTAALRGLVPVATAVVLVRSNGRPRADHDLTAFVHLREGGAVVATGTSVNERLVETGHARMDPPIDRSGTEDAVQAQITAVAAALPGPDHDYLPMLAAAENRAWTAGNGSIGVCARRQQELERDRAVAAISAENWIPPQTSAVPETAASPTAAPAPPVTAPGQVHVEITVQRPPRPRPCERFDRC